MSVFGFCKNKCKHKVYTEEETENLIFKGTMLLETTLHDDGKYLKLFDLDFPYAFKDHYIMFDLADVQSGGYYKRYFLDVRKDDFPDNIVIREFREVFEQKSINKDIEVYAVVESNRKLSVWRRINGRYDTPTIKIVSDMYYMLNDEIITITPNIVVDALPAGEVINFTKDKVVITGTQTLSHEAGNYKENSWQIAYPFGYNKTNTIVLAYVTGIKGCFDTSTSVSVGAYGEKDDITGFMGGTMAKRIILTNDYIDVRCTNMLTDQDAIIDYKIVLMKA